VVYPQTRDDPIQEIALRGLREVAVLEAESASD